MSKSSDQGTSRRGFLKSTGKLAAGSAVAAGFVPRVHPGEDNTIKLALVGCGGRGSGSIKDALAGDNGPLKLVAMADVFDARLTRSFTALHKQFAKDMDVPEERKFVGFDAYRQAIDCLDPGDVVILATPPAFRWVQFAYAIEKGMNAFIEKPLTVDGPTTLKMLELGKQSVRKNLKVGVGLMCRHCDARRELFQRIKDGQIGDILTLRAYRMAGMVGSFASKKKPAGMSDLLYQIQRFHSFLWASGGCFSDFNIHNIDECCWMKDAWPIRAKATGGRHYREDYIDQNFDSYSVEYTFADGTKLLLNGRCIEGCHSEFASYAHGTKGLAVISSKGHWPSRTRLYQGHSMEDGDLRWLATESRQPKENEWIRLIEAIRRDRPYNEVKRGSEASLVTSMGRMAAHTGRVVTYDEMLNFDHEFAPGVDTLSMNSPSPLPANADGTYPLPQPGILKREY